MTSVHRAAITTFVVLAVIMRASVTADRLFFKGKTGDRETSIYATVGENIVLECEAGGSPSPTIHWLHNGRRIQQVGRWRVSITVGQQVVGHSRVK